jgi:SAM-dependent methyltransferase
MTTRSSISAALDTAATELGTIEGLPPNFVDVYRERHQFELELVLGRKGTDITLWDLGGGTGLFAAAASLLGVRATIVDTFLDLELYGPNTVASTISKLDGLGVRTIRHDFDKGPAPLESGIDVVTTFHTIEHLHNSPRAEYQRVADALAPGGLFVIAGPNAVNLRKRITTPLGKTEWSTMEHWYHEPRFRAHVREPRAADLAYIAQDIGLEAEILGKNFLGLRHTGWKGRVTRAIGPVLEKRPTLCSDLYMVGSKP